MNYDIRFKTPFSLILSGASGSGKTTWLEHFLSIFNKITDGKGKYEKVYGSAGPTSPTYLKELRVILRVLLECLIQLIMRFIQKLKRKEKTPL